jgi:hypothetical protein
MQPETAWFSRFSKDDPVAPNTFPNTLPSVRR